MKSLFFVCCLSIQFIATATFAADPEPIRVTTFNIRYGTAPDGENVWVNRTPLIWEFLDSEKPQVMGLQEALPNQISDILEHCPQYVSLGVGRDADGSGEYSALLYDRNRFDVLSAETFWLSDTPSVRGSRTWGANFTRLCTWARLFDRTTKRVFTVMNTHWDHESQPSRLKSGQLMAKRIREFDPADPLIVMGDFNIGPSDPARQALTEVGLRDSFLDLHPNEEQVGTFHGFTGKPGTHKIDAILVSKQWLVSAAEIIRTERDGVYLSDHYPVTATLELKDAE